MFAQNSSDYDAIIETDFIYYLEQEESLSFGIDNSYNGKHSSSEVYSIKADFTRNKNYSNEMLKHTLLDLAEKGRLPVYALTNKTRQLSY